MMAAGWYDCCQFAVCVRLKSKEHLMARFLSHVPSLRLAALALALGAAAVLIGPRLVQASADQQAANLLINGGFEPFVTADGKYDYPIYSTPEGGGHVAEGWTPWWYNDPGPTYSVPEYDIAPIYRDAWRVRSGNAAQQIFRPSVMWLAGVYQRVSVPTNANLQFTIYGHAWAGFCQPVGDGGSDCGDNHNSHYGLGANPTVMKIGIDPYGGTDWSSPSIVWSQDYNIHDYYQQLAVTARAQGGFVTVFTYTTFAYPAVINNVYWDDAALVVSSGAAAPPTTVPPSGAPTGLVLEATTTLNVRTGPGTSNAVIGQIRPGARYTVLGQSGEWYNINFNGQSGYVYGPLTTVTAGTVPVVPPGQGVESTVTLNVRSGPGTGYTVIGKIYPGAVYQIVGQTTDWYQIDYNGQMGWVYGAYVVVR
jgi:uncharacterized protein YraI